MVTTNQPMLDNPQAPQSKRGKRLLCFFVSFFLATTLVVGAPPVANADPEEPDQVTTTTGEVGEPEEPEGPATTPSSSGVIITVQLDSNGGTLEETSISLEVGEVITGLPTPTRSQFVFVGWFTEEGVRVANGDILEADDDFTLFAQWLTGTLYTFDPRGGEVSIESISAAPGKKLGPLPSAKRSGYAFLGWYTKASGGTKVTSATVAPKTSGSKILYAHWKKARHYVFNPNGGTVAKEYKDVKPGAKVGTLPKPTREEYVFRGWWTQKSGGVKVTSTTKAGKAGTKTLYARWAATVTYTFDPNLGKVSKTSKVAAGKAGPLPHPTRKNYSFMGWHTQKKHGGTKVTSKSSTGSTPRTIALYARWAPVAMYQKDGRWSGRRYSTGTISNSGCGPSAASIAVRGVTGNSSITPPVAAAWSQSHGYTQAAAGRTKPAFFIDWPKSRGVKVTRIPGGTSAAADAKALQAVKDGNWVIAFMRPGNWAVNGHYMVWYDYSGSRALVRDPVSNSPHRTRGSIKLLQQQSWTYYIVHVPDNKKLYG